MTALTGARVLITAGGSGIGRAMAEAFDQAGAKVWIADIALGEPRESWRATALDASDEDAIAALYAEIERDWGGLDAVCANAGIAGPTAPVEDVKLEDWRRCLAVNLDGAFLAAKYAAPMMKRAGKGALTLTSSTAGLYGYPHRSPYASAKWGVIGLMKTLAMELGPYGIRANAICPGSVAGPRMDGVIEREAVSKGMTPEAVRAGYEEGVSMRAFVEARDIAAMAVFLASPAGRYVSGQAIAVDGHTENPAPQIKPQQ